MRSFDKVESNGEIFLTQLIYEDLFLITLCLKPKNNMYIYIYYAKGEYKKYI